MGTEDEPDVAPGKASKAASQVGSVRVHHSAIPGPREPTPLFVFCGTHFLFVCTELCFTNKKCVPHACDVFTRVERQLHWPASQVAPKALPPAHRHPCRQWRQKRTTVPRSNRMDCSPAVAPPGPPSVPLLRLQLRRPSGRAGARGQHHTF
jgi:hypothetical protein